MSAGATVAVVGFPNAGKSTLVNRLSGTRQAVVHETPGVTRDRKDVACEWAGRTFTLVDTGGVDAGDASPLQAQVAAQAREAVALADLVLFVVDARAGLAAGDEEIAQILRRSGRPVVVVANKVDDAAHEADALELHRLGLGDPVPVSALHGRNTGELLDEVVARLGPAGGNGAGVDEEADDEIRVSILGRPNVGKSSLLNALVGRPRTVVSDVPGTTRDAIDTLLEHGGRRYRLVDTAGLRRKRSQRQGIEYYSEVRALQAASRSDIALVLVDSEEGLVDGDLHVADEARKAGCATLVVLSKWDIARITVDEVAERVGVKLRQRPAIVTTSAVTGRNLDRLLDTVAELFGRYTSRVSTAGLNRALEEITALRQPPRHGRRQLNVLYGTQYRTRPPRFRLVVNDRGLVTRDYAYFLENQLRKRLDLEGCPLIIDVTSRR